MGEEFVKGYFRGSESLICFYLCLLVVAIWLGFLGGLGCFWFFCGGVVWLVGFVWIECFGSLFVCLFSVLYKPLYTGMALLMILHVSIDFLVPKNNLML